MGSQVEEVSAQLEQAIAAGRYGAARRLPAERTLAVQFGVSRATVREAIGSLVARGLLQRRQGDGTYVLPESDRHMAEVWLDMVQRHPALQGDLIEFRAMLESRAAELAALRRDAHDCARLQAAHAAVDAAYAGGDRDEQIRSDVAFHRAIADASHNPVFSYLTASLLKVLHEHVQLSLAGLQPQSPTSRQLRVQHSALLAAILDGDAPRARAAAGQHMDFVAVRLNAQPPRARRAAQSGS
jgi:GntR family transcriptional regulator, transcriptional repressor for pyruvate dehydrogenase complex